MSCAIGSSGSTPERVYPLPTLGLKRPPHLLRCLLPKVASLLKQRWSIRHRSASVQENLRVNPPGGVISVQPTHPVVVAVDQPPLFHRSCAVVQPFCSRQKGHRKQFGLGRCRCQLQDLAFQIGVNRIYVVAVLSTFCIHLTFH